MIERGSGATTDLGGTNWTLLDVPTIWATLADHDTGNHWRLVVGWRRTCELTMTHLGRLTEYRERLVQAWPPERSAAAREYVDRLDHLIDSLRQTHDVAAANYDTFSAATTAIGATRTKVRAVHDQYVAKQQQKQEYEENVARLQAAGMANVRGLRPPVADGELEQLNIRARELMTGLSGELRQAQAQLRQPPTAWQASKSPHNPDVYPDDQPLIPPIVPLPLNQNRRPPEPPTPASNRPVAAPVATSVGPILGSASTSTLPPHVNPAPSGLNPPAGPPPIGGGGPPFAIPPGVGLPSSPGSPLRIGDPATRNSTSSPTGGRGLRSGSVIGGTPGAPFNQPSTRTAPEKRINPVGGIIGSGGAGTNIVGNSGQRPGTGSSRTSPSNRHDMLPLGTPLSPNGSHRTTEQRKPQHWDPDHPWETAEGVDPIMRRPHETDRVDPGPAIGLDR
ncbi:hypothetical protein V6U90_13310 [Micromonospora sp. CPCC 206060]|uniref:hypothetical protein n=1 Tax=Micromonospora sp. CPCC 206060 TaxID=3122406 RepID=UPI002FEF3354